MSSATAAASDAVVLRATGVSRAFGATRALTGVSLEVRRGEIIAVLGPNGAGKTTLLSVLTGSARPTEGTLEINGQPVSPRDPLWRSNIGVVSHRSGLYGHLTALENLRFFAVLHGLQPSDGALTQALSDVGLAEHATRHVREFSRGMAQRVALARATLHEPEVLLLDEPFTGLDAEAAKALETRLLEQKAQGRGVVLVTHRAAVAARVADRLLVLARGHTVYDGRDFPREELEPFLAAKVGGQG